MSLYHLGEFEEIVLLTVAVLNGEAYGVSIIDEIESRMERQVTIGAVQTVLKRLESKGMVLSGFGEPSNIRGGKRKRFYRITASGKQVLKDTKDKRLSMWDSIPEVVLK
jgi:PadR family transcriptional regulator PadR